MIPYDKALHVIYGAGWALLGYNAALMYGLPLLESATVGFALSIAAGIGKEVRDAYRNSKSETPVNSVEVFDAIATAMGGLYLLIVVALPKLI